MLACMKKVFHVLIEVWGGGLSSIILGLEDFTSRQAGDCKGTERWAVLPLSTTHRNGPNIKY